MTNTLMTFDSRDNTFMKIKIPTKNKNCAICGENRTIFELQDYPQWCGSSPTDTVATLKEVPEDLDVSITDYKKILDEGVKHLLLDVRVENQFSICRLPHAVNIPLRLLQISLEKVKDILRDTNTTDVYCLCRRGNDSQIAVKLLQAEGINAKNLNGGLKAWSLLVDNNFPLY
eukprot:TRINITY_DN4654_c0_g1_i2.p1 TRINITY_DN4654_c0_g1~~TRINITY_DN4654_c0_g1_i2.p1  ORF type:complete len:173 (+),score=18.25 TRINITY_DN4654_c0_g1_i2:125-643(+)